MKSIFKNVDTTTTEMANLSISNDTNSSLDTNILKAAELLELTLSSLNLPLTFPDAENILSLLKELFQFNYDNQRILSELITLEVIFLVIINIIYFYQIILESNFHIIFYIQK